MEKITTLIHLHAKKKKSILLSVCQHPIRSLRLRSLPVNEEFLVSAGHKVVSIKSLPFVHTHRRYYTDFLSFLHLSKTIRDGTVKLWRLKLDHGGSSKYGKRGVCERGTRGDWESIFGTQLDWHERADGSWEISWRSVDAWNMKPIPEKLSKFCLLFVPLPLLCITTLTKHARARLNHTTVRRSSILSSQIYNSDSKNTPDQSKCTSLLRKMLHFAQATPVGHCAFHWASLTSLSILEKIC